MGGHYNLVLEWVLGFFQLVLIYDVRCGTWISFHPSFYPIDSNFNSGTIARARLSTLTWKVKSSCSSSWTYFAVNCDFDGESFWFFLPLHMRAKWPFFEHRRHVFPKAWEFDLGPLWSKPQASAFFVVVVRWLGFAFILWFPGSLWVNSVNTVLIRCKLFAPYPDLGDRYLLCSSRAPVTVGVYIF